MSDENPVSRILRGVTGERKRMILIIALVVASLVATGFVGAYKKIHIVTDGTTVDVKTIYSDPERVLKQAGFALQPNDEYRLSTSKLTDGATIEIFRAVPVTVTYQGNTVAVVTGKPTVAEVADSLGIPHDNVRLVPDDNTRPAADMNIRAITLTEKMVERQEPAVYQIVRQPDSTLEKGQEEMAQSGADGVKKLLIRQKFADGQLVSSETVSETIVEQPRPQIIHVGTRDTVQTSRGSIRFRSTRYMEATAYTPHDGSGNGITASGMAARHGIVAVDPGVIPLGTRLYIPGYGLALAADTGGDIVGNRIDLCMEEYGDAWHFGRRDVKVYILE